MYYRVIKLTFGVILVTSLKKRKKSLVPSWFSVILRKMGPNHWWIGYGTESHPLWSPMGGGRLPGSALGWGSPVTKESDASVSIGSASFRVRCSLPVDWSDGPSRCLLPAPAGTSGSGLSAAKPAAWACSTARSCVARCTPTAAWRCSPTAASTWRSPTRPAPASSRSAASGRSGRTGPRYAVDGLLWSCPARPTAALPPPPSQTWCGGTLGSPGRPFPQFPGRTFLRHIASAGCQIDLRADFQSGWPMGDGCTQASSLLCHGGVKTSDC